MPMAPVDPLARKVHQRCHVMPLAKHLGRELVKKRNDLQIENIFVYAPEARGRDINRELVQFFQKQFERVD